MPDAKRTQRTEMRRIRAAISDRADRVGAMWTEVERVCRSNASAAATVLAFAGVGSEPDTTALLDRLIAAGFVVALPRVEDDRIVAVVHGVGDSLVSGRFGIPEPTGPAIDPAAIDVVVVPGLAFTPDGRRLGQGGGFYDRFLAHVRADCLTIGVCFREQIVDDLPSEAHDRVVDIVVSDELR